MYVPRREKGRRTDALGAAWPVPGGHPRRARASAVRRGAVGRSAVCDGRRSPGTRCDRWQAARRTARGHGHERRIPLPDHAARAGHALPDRPGRPDPAVLTGGAGPAPAGSVAPRPGPSPVRSVGRGLRRSIRSAGAFAGQVGSAGAFAGQVRSAGLAVVSPAPSLGRPPLPPVVGRGLRRSGRFGRGLRRSGRFGRGLRRSRRSSRRPRQGRPPRAQPLRRDRAPPAPRPPGRRRAAASQAGRAVRRRWRPASGRDTGRAWLPAGCARCRGRNRTRCRAIRCRPPCSSRSS